VTNGHSKKLDVRGPPMATSKITRQQRPSALARSSGTQQGAGHGGAAGGWAGKRRRGDWLARRRIVWLRACASAGTTSAQRLAAQRGSEAEAEAEASTAASAFACVHDACTATGAAAGFVSCEAMPRHATPLRATAPAPAAETGSESVRGQ
jgi:hypothetical protein